MAEIAKDSIEWELHQDFWKLHKAFAEPEGTQEWCDKLVKAVTDFRDRYKQTDVDELAEWIGVGMIILMHKKWRELQ